MFFCKEQAPLCLILKSLFKRHSRLLRSNDLCNIKHYNRYIGLLCRQMSLFHTSFTKLTVIIKARRINNHARAKRMNLHRLVHRVCCRTCHIGHNGNLLLCNRIDQ